MNGVPSKPPSKPFVPRTTHREEPTMDTTPITLAEAYGLRHASTHHTHHEHPLATFGEERTEHQLSVHDVLDAADALGADMELRGAVLDAFERGYHSSWPNTQGPVDDTLEAKKARYATRLKEMSANELMDELVSVSRSNQYGSHDEQIQLVRSEVRVRMAS